jgi:hypothetical protein
MYLRRMICAVICTVLAAPAILSALAPAAQPAPAPSGPIAPADSLNGLMTALGYEVVGAAEAMPADKYDFAPPASLGEFKGVRTFGAQVKHLAESNYEFFQGWTVPGATAVDSKTIEALKTKDDIVKALKDSYLYAHAAIGTEFSASAVQDHKGVDGCLLHCALDGSLRADGRVPAHERDRAAGQPAAGGNVKAAISG